MEVFPLLMMIYQIIMKFRINYYNIPDIAVILLFLVNIYILIEFFSLETLIIILLGYVLSLKILILYYVNFMSVVFNDRDMYVYVIIKIIRNYINFKNNKNYKNKMKP